MYYKEKISHHQNSITQLWKTFGKILNKNKVKHKDINNLIINDKTVSEPQTIVNHFNKFYCEVGE